MRQRHSSINLKNRYQHVRVIFMPVICNFVFPNDAKYVRGELGTNVPGMSCLFHAMPGMYCDLLVYMPSMQVRFHATHASIYMPI